jgi:hypothetical protein
VSGSGVYTSVEPDDREAVHTRPPPGRALYHQGPDEIKTGDAGKISVGLDRSSDHKNRPAFRYKITDVPAGIDQDDTDPQGSPVA